MRGFYSGVAVVAFAMSASAVPRVGERVPAVVVEDLDGDDHKFPDPSLPTLLTYESQSTEVHNQALKRRLAAITRRAANLARFRFAAVGDVAKWNWWPAKRVGRSRAKEKQSGAWAQIFLDWSGEMRRTWSFKSDTASVALVTPDGKVQFASEGPLSDERIGELMKKLAELGADTH